MLANGRKVMSLELEKLLGRRELRQIVPRTDMTIYRWERNGKFPRCIKINGRSYWRVSEVKEWQRNNGVAVSA
jgi:predicted DNA-binding transcriptional regulator AlpA